MSKHDLDAQITTLRKGDKLDEEKVRRDDTRACLEHVIQFIFTTIP